MMRCSPSLFPEVDFSGDRYTLQEMSFSGSLSFHKGQREVRVLELGVGHSESDEVVHLPREKIVFCGDVFLNPSRARIMLLHVRTRSSIAKCFSSTDFHNSLNRPGFSGGCLV